MHIHVHVPVHVQFGSFVVPKLIADGRYKLWDVERGPSVERGPRRFRDKIPVLANQNPAVIVSQRLGS